MLNKIYQKIKQYIKENWGFLLTIIIVVTFCLYDTGYSIYKPGGTINVSERVSGDDITTSSGTFNMAYVSMIKGRLPYYLLAKLFSDWELVKDSDIVYSDDETINDALTRDRLYYQEAISNAKIVAYNYSNTDYTITSQNNDVVYVSEENDSDLQIGDDLISYDDIKYTTIDDVISYVNTKSVGDKVKLIYSRDDKEYTTYSTVYNEGSQNYIGVSIVTLYNIDSDNNIKMDTKSSESGPSGGLIMSLVMYDALVPEDITKGNTIVGTGTIDAEGNVGEIGSVTYKLAAAVKDDADIFLCPKENYDEAVAYAKEKNYDIIIKGVSTFSEALEVLNNMEEKNG